MTEEVKINDEEVMEQVEQVEQDDCPDYEGYGYDVQTKSLKEHQRTYWTSKGSDGTVRRFSAPRVWERKGNEWLFGDFCLNYARYGSISKACKETIIPDKGKPLNESIIYNIKNENSPYYVKEYADMIEKAKGQFHDSLADLARWKLKDVLMKEYHKEETNISIGKLALDSLKAIEQQQLRHQKEEDNIIQAEVITQNIEEENTVLAVVDNMADLDNITAEDADALLPTI